MALTALQKELQTTKEHFSTSTTVLSDKKTTLETQLDAHKKQQKLLQAEYTAEKVSSYYNSSPCLVSTSGGGGM